MTTRLPYVEPWTTDRVAARLREASATLRRLPAGGHSLKVTWWPDVLHDRTEAYGYTPQAITSTLASSDQIDRLDLTLAWVTRHLSRPACARSGLVIDSGWIVWARASGWSYARIGAARKAAWGGQAIKGGPNAAIPGGNARPSLMKIERRGLLHLAALLNQTPEPVDRDARIARAPVNESPKEVPTVEGIRTIAPPRSTVMDDD